jgi:hypothetical protein
VLYKDIDRSRCQIDSTSAVLGLWLNQNQPYAALSLKRPADRQLALLEIDVIPHEAKCFAKPETGRCQHHPQGMAPSVVRYSGHNKIQNPRRRREADWS